MTPSRRPALWPAILSLGLVLAAILVLVWLRGRLEAQDRSTLVGAVRLFETTGILGRPENRGIRFSSIEQLSDAIESGETIIELRVTKRLRTGAEVTVRPFDAEIASPFWREERGWERMPVGDAPDGYLYFRLDRTGITAVDRTLGTFAFFFILGTAILVVRQRDREHALARTASELESRNAEVIRLERLALAGQLSANIFHDLKKPILNIKHEVDDAADAPPDPALLAAIRQQTELFLTMMRELGFEDFVRGGTGEPEWCDLRETIERSLRLVRYEQRDVRPTIDAGDGRLPLVLAQRHRLLQLFSNISLNACQALKGKGRLQFTIRRDGPRRVSVLIDDDGPGIPVSRRDRIFDAFETTRREEGGTGLGLYICRRIVDDLGGTIRVADSPFGGARFEISLPAEAQETP